MHAGGRGVSVVLVVLVAGALCVGSYVLGLKQGAAGGDREGSVPHDGRNALVIEPEVDAAGKDRRMSGNGGSLPSVPRGEYPSSDKAGREEIETEQRQRLMRNIEANLEMPGMSRIIREQQRVLMADQFQSLMETLGLNEEEKEYFIDLLTARQMYQVDMGMKLMTGLLSAEERNALMQRVGAGIEQVDAEIDWFLNNETDSEYFDYYQRTEGERTIVESVGDQLRQAGYPLEEGMDRELIAIMHEESSAYPFSVEFEDSGEPDFSRFTDGNIDTFIREMQNVREPMMQDAALVLDAQQLQVFADSFDQYVAFYEQRLRMVQQLFNPAQ